MPHALSKPCTAFAGSSLIASGMLADVAPAVKAVLTKDPAATVLTFDDATGAVVALDLRGTTAEILSRLAERRVPDEQPGTAPQDAPSRLRGRPKLGVVAREVTLLSRHWEWLASQPGGASHALRRLVDAARRTDGGQRRLRHAEDDAYRCLSAMAGDLAGFEEAARALFAEDREGFAQQAASWPADVRTYAQKLAWSEAASTDGDQPGRIPRRDSPLLSVKD